MYKSHVEKAKGDVWHFYFKIPKEIAAEFIDGKNRRVICTVNELVDFPCALMHDGQGKFFINLNKEIRKKLGLNPGEQISYSLKKDTSKYGMPMPEEMEELLAIDDEALHYFDKLTPGKQRSLIYLVLKLKSSNARLNKALAITEFLKAHHGKLDYKLFNAFLKDFNKI